LALNGTTEVVPFPFIGFGVIGALAGCRFGRPCGLGFLDGAGGNSMTEVALVRTAGHAPWF